MSKQVPLLYDITIVELEHHRTLTTVAAAIRPFSVQTYFALPAVLLLFLLLYHITINELEQH